MLKLVGVLALVCMAYAAVEIYLPEEKPAEYANQSGCWISVLNRVLPFDQYYYREDKCERLLCRSSNNQTIEESCGEVQINDGCRKSADDLTKRYPDCCGTEVCNTTTTQATTEATTQAPTTQVPDNQGSVAYASAESNGDGQPKTVEYTSGPNAQADATAS